LKIIQDKNAQVEVIEYLNEVPTIEVLKNVLQKLNMSAQDIVRKGEPIFKELYKGRQLTEDEWIEALVQHPKLIERPIVVNGNKAVLGRPPENVIGLL
jgi:arsenate reductase